METLFIILSLCMAALVLLITLFSLLSPSISSTPMQSQTKTKTKANMKLPPGPNSIVPIIGNLLWLRKSFSELEPVLRCMYKKYGPLVTVRSSPRPAILIADRSLAHQALIQNSAIFAARPAALPVIRVFSSNQHSISSATYGPTWHLLRRNLTSKLLHPSRVKSYAPSRTRVLHILIDLLEKESSPLGEPVRVFEHFQHAMFGLLAFMCFGDELEEKKIKEVEAVQRKLLLSVGRFNILNYFWPRVGKVLFRNRWKELMQLRKCQEDVLIPLIRARTEAKLESTVIMSYVDTLMSLRLPEEKRELNEGEMVSLCLEFLNAGTDTTSTALQWIMANLVKYPNLQEKLFAEINEVMGKNGGQRGEEVREEDLQKMPYLKAVILEGLRRHPPAHFVMSHAVAEDVELNGYVVPKNATVNFMVAEMGRDPKVWDDPMAFRPERFLSGGGGDGGGDEFFDITGRREIKMMPFGAGRRMCPGYGLAMFHLEYFVANLVWQFEWKGGEGEEVDLSEKHEFTIVMKFPLRARISPRARSIIS